MKTSLIFRFIAYLFLLILIIITVLNFYVGSKLKNTFAFQTSNRLKTDAELIAEIIKPQILNNNVNLLKDTTFKLSKQFNFRMTVLSPQGIVLADSYFNSTRNMENHSDREEIISALNSNYGECDRYSETQKLTMKYIAVPIMEKNNVIALIRLAVPMMEIHNQVKIIYRAILFGGIISLIIAFFLGILIFKSIIHPIKEMQITAKSIEKGDFSSRIKVKSNDELGELAKSYNKMADELQKKIEYLKNSDKMKTEFVANVSHELKTPLTSILGFLETIEDLNAKDIEKIKRFISIIKKQSLRLNNIVNDLLSLSKIDSNVLQLKHEEFDIKTLLEEIIEGFGHAAKEKNIKFNLKFPKENCIVNSYKDGIQHIFVNIIDNAIKYSKENVPIEITLSKNDKSLKITVEDNGIGIAEKHLPYIFERFYIVDKARSKISGGTGLGLSIVKELINILHGEIIINSRINEGTIVTIILHSAIAVYK